MAVSLGVSALFHLSMVTLFSIGIWFEVEPVDYYEFEFVNFSELRQARAQAARPAAPRQVLRVPSLDNPLDMTDPAAVAGGVDAPSESPFELDAEETLLASLPEVELPTVLFADLDRLRLRERSLEIRSRHDAMLAAERGDSWSRFGREIGQLRDALGRLPFFDRESEQAKPILHPVSIPAEGFAAHIEWMTEPKDRQLLFSPPVTALLELDPAELTEPISFVFRVGPDGRVREVLQGAAMMDEDLLISLLRALRNYRFAPLPAGETGDQHGTLLISASPTP